MPIRQAQGPEAESRDSDPDPFDSAQGHPEPVEQASGLLRFLKSVLKRLTRHPAAAPGAPAQTSERSRDRSARLPVSRERALTGVPVDRYLTFRGLIEEHAAWVERGGTGTRR